MTVPDDDHTVKEKEFEKYHDKLRVELNRASWHFAICKHLQELEKTYPDELHMAPAFFRLTLEAHFFTTAMRLSRFFDKPNGHLAIGMFLDFVEENPEIFSNQAFEKRMRGKETYDMAMRKHAEFDSIMIEQDRKRIRQLPIANLRRLRNKELAHIGQDYVLQNVNAFRRHPLTIDGIETIISTLDEILNRYYLAYVDTTWRKDLPLEGGIQEIVDAIRFKLQEERKRRMIRRKESGL